MFARKIIVDKQFKHILSARFGSWCTAAKSGLSTQASSIVFYTLHKNTFLWTWSWRVMNGRLLLCSACYSLGSGTVASHFWKVLDFLNPAVMDMDFFSPLSQISITSRFLELYRNLKESFFFLSKTRSVHIKQVEILANLGFLSQSIMHFLFWIWCISNVRLCIPTRKVRCAQQLLLFLI